MDFQIPLIFIGIFVIASLSLLIVYKFGIKEKSYEEALAEQRQQNQALLGVKPNKPKDKKNKKAKKIKDFKEKASLETETADESEQSPSHSNLESSKKSHVEFKDVEEIKQGAVKKRIKKEKVKPILLNKDVVKAIVDVKDVASVNHFEVLHPKDEFELLISSSSDGLLKQEVAVKPIKAKQIQSEPDILKKLESPKKIPKTPQIEEKIIKKLDPSIIEKEDKTPPSGSPTNGLITNIGKEKKKKKSEFNTLQQLTGDKNGANVSILLDLVRKAELSRSEVQILIDLLLNKQHEAPVIMDEWTEGKFDPVQKLKKQLAEKEKLLIEEQEALQGAQNKLRIVRTEQLSERSQLHQKIRGFEDILQNKQIEFNRLHGQMQQLQVQLNEELLKERQLREELGTMQIQRQQYEMRINQAQETEVVVTQLRQEVGELTSHNQQLRIEFQRISEEHVTEQERNQSFIVQLNHFQKELEQKNDRLRQLEEAGLEIERNLENNIRQENEFKLEISRLNSNYQQQAEELRRLELVKNQYQEELIYLKKQKEDSDKIIGQLREEKSQSNGSLEECKAHKIEILNLHNELSSFKSQLEQSETRYKKELEITNNTVDKLQNELKEQKTKNNELRQKSWKVMEALNAAESRRESNNSKIDYNQIKIDIIKKEQESYKQFIQRLFPDIKEINSMKPEVLQDESEELIKIFIENLQCSNNIKQLETQIQTYRNVIDNTDKMLSNLQSHIEREEINWQKQLNKKSTELEAMKEKLNQNVDEQEIQFAYKNIEKLIPMIINELQNNCSYLENKLEQSQQEQNRIIIEYEELKRKSDDTNSIVLVEQLSEEANRLKDQLQIHQYKSSDIACSKIHNCNTTNGPPVIQYSSSSSIASSLTDISVKKAKNKKKKKKGSGN